MKNGLESITESVKSASGSLPAEIHQSLGTSINTNNDAVLQGYTNATEFLNNHLEEFKNELTSFVQSASAGARGEN